MENAKDILIQSIKRSTETGESLLIAIQKEGRLTPISLGLLKACFDSCGITLPERKQGELVLTAAEYQNIAIVLAKNADIPWYVVQGSAQFGIVGEDQVVEYRAEQSIASFLGVAQSTLCIAVMNNSPIRSIMDLEGTRVATSYPTALRTYLNAHGVTPAEIIELSGSVEAAAVTQNADAVCDIVETGFTLKANNMRVVTKVRDYQAVLIAQNRSS